MVSPPVTIECFLVLGFAKSAVSTHSEQANEILSGTSNQNCFLDNQGNTQ